MNRFCLLLFMCCISNVIHSQSDDFFSPPAVYGWLTITWAGVIDNGEGDDYPHGPWGNLYVAVYPNSSSGPNIYEDDYYSRQVLEGPSSGKRSFGKYASDEWLDGDAMRMNLRIHEWNSPYESVIVVVYESDAANSFAPNRRHDVLFCYRVDFSSLSGGSIVLGDDYRKANSDAIANCKRSGITWYQDVWRHGLNYGIPKMFLQLANK